jgi:hypothetical protein
MHCEVDLDQGLNQTGAAFRSDAMYVDLGQLARESRVRVLLQGTKDLCVMAGKVLNSWPRVTKTSACT